MKHIDHSVQGELSFAEPIAFLLPIIAFVANLVIAYGNFNVDVMTRDAAEFGAFCLVLLTAYAMFRDFGSKGAEVR